MWNYNDSITTWLDAQITMFLFTYIHYKSPHNYMRNPSGCESICLVVFVAFNHGFSFINHNLFVCFFLKKLDWHGNMIQCVNTLVDCIIQANLKWEY